MRRESFCAQTTGFKGTRGNAELVDLRDDSNFGCRFGMNKPGVSHRNFNVTGLIGCGGRAKL